MAPPAALPLILLAEDNPDDAFLVRLALQKAGLANPLFVVRDGEEAVQYLAGQGPYADRSTYPFPGLLLLDISMPRMNGFDVLAWRKQHTHVCELPTIVLSGSSREEDKQNAEQLGATDYHVKPVGIDNLIVLVQELHSHWLNGHASNSELLTSNS